MAIARAKLIRVIVYWGTEGLPSEGWAFRAEYQNGAFKRGSLNAQENDLRAAIEDAIRATGINACPDEFVPIPSSGVRAAVWLAK